MLTSATNSGMIHINQVQKYYDGRLILTITDYTFSDGVYWIKGINGSGKTTFLRILSGMMPFQGAIAINNISLKKQPVEYRKQVSFAAAEPQYPAFITGKDLVLYYQQIRQAPEKQVQRLIEFSGLGQALNSATGTYSSGMVKRLSLLLAFIGGVKWIILDEPLATLDVEAAHALPDLIKEFQQQYGTNFLFSSHQSFLPDAAISGRELLIDNQTLQSIL
jgi:ABC-2 type transport system ATP-binding protein